MKQALITLLLFSFGFASAQQSVMINEDFYQKMMDLNIGWTNFDMPTKLKDREARFSAYQCMYFSGAKPTKPTECSRGLVQIEASKGKYIPYFEFPEFPSCSILKLGIQAGDKKKICGIAIQQLQNEEWKTVDETTIDAKQKCIFWFPNNIKSDSPLKLRLIATKAGSVYLTDVYAEEKK